MEMKKFGRGEAGWRGVVRKHASPASQAKSANRVFHKHSKLAILSLLPTLNKCEIRCQWVQEDYILGLKTSLILLISNGTAKRKLAILAFLYCREFVKNSNA